ncbi:hypothetical protein GI482_02315 [Bacillus sp. N3536]|nr:hypothetical protein GI482_02315 [Bacillus sp. N3536]
MLLKRTIDLLVSIIFVSLLFPLTTGAATNIPNVPRDSYLVDLEGYLADETNLEIERLGSRLKQGTTAQMVVMIIDNIGDQSAEQFNMEVIRENKIGSVRKKNGIVILIEANPINQGGPTVEITVDRDLEEAISYEKVDRIIDQYTMPYLNQGFIDEAVLYTYQALYNEVIREYGLKEETIQPQVYTTSNTNRLSIPTVVVIALVIFLLYRMINRNRGHERK